MPEKARELLEEFHSVTGKVGLLDTIIPPVLFLLLNGLAGFETAMAGSLGLAFVIAIVRLRRRQSLAYALAGMGSVGLAIALAYLLGRSEGYFLPAIVNGGLTVALALVSIIIRKPMVAWTSYLARRWPLDWYWHSRVRPAYTEVTVVWVLFFALRLFWQVTLFQGNDISQLALVNALMGWPAIVLLLIFSYLYGTWRLARLGGPSVDEFRENRPAPWQSQRRGF
ncbi:MAG: DUF3159 domain-containing protein [Anaerolineales bacterium]|nr:MAG: DUF3159 domain-containing protein [Anaerolineales bacterium]